MSRSAKTLPRHNHAHMQDPSTPKSPIRFVWTERAGTGNRDGSRRGILVYTSPVDIHLRHPHSSIRIVWRTKDRRGPKPRTECRDGGELHNTSLYTNYLREEGPSLLWPSFKRRIVIYRYMVRISIILPLFFWLNRPTSLFLIVSNKVVYYISYLISSLFGTRNSYVLIGLSLGLARFWYSARLETLDS